MENETNMDPVQEGEQQAQPETAAPADAPAAPAEGETVA